MIADTILMSFRHGDGFFSKERTSFPWYTVVYRKISWR